jgi:DNA-binding NtrC family response regulator
MDTLGHHASSEKAIAKPALRVLVIDDDASVRAAIQAILARRKSETEIAPRVHAGIQALEFSRRPRFRHSGRLQAAHF